MTLFASKDVLVPIDFSEEAHKALKDTLEFVEDPQQIHVLYVLAPLEPTEPGIIWQTIDDQTRIARVTETFYKRFSEDAYRQMKFTFAIGDPSSKIIDYAKHNAINLIVIPSSGRTGHWSSRG